MSCIKQVEITSPLLESRIPEKNHDSELENDKNSFFPPTSPFHHPTTVGFQLFVIAEENLRKKPPMNAKIREIRVTRLEKRRELIRTPPKFEKQNECKNCWRISESQACKLILISFNALLINFGFAERLLDVLRETKTTVGWKKFLRYFAPNPHFTISVNSPQVVLIFDCTSYSLGRQF